MKIGFTGTREGMTPKQFAEFERIVSALDGDFAEFHHGDCYGSDFEAAECLAAMRDESDMEMRDFKIISHPPIKDGLRANATSDEIRDPKPYLDRNRVIVDECDVLFATPKETPKHFVRKGGTWYTIRYAQRVKKPIHIIWPDGSVSGDWKAGAV